jgi:hypothetical protein
MKAPVNLPEWYITYTLPFFFCLIPGCSFKHGKFYVRYKSWDQELKTFWISDGLTNILVTLEMWTNIFWLPSQLLLRMSGKSITSQKLLRHCWQQYFPVPAWLRIHGKETTSQIPKHALYTKSKTSVAITIVTSGFKLPSNCQFPLLVQQFQIAVLSSEQ